MSSQTLAYKTDPTGHKVLCDVYTSKEPPVGVLIFIRMSGFMCFSRKAAGTRRGYTVINIDHRLAPQVKIDGIYQDVEDCVNWIRSGELAKALGATASIDASKVIVAGGSAGGHLALLTGLNLSPPPLAIISLYTLADPTAPGINDASFPSPPRGRDKLIEWDEVSAFLDEKVPAVSESQLDDLDLRTATFKNRGAAMAYVGQQGLLYPTVYGTTNVNEIREKWSVPHRLRNPAVTSFPPTYLIHSLSDSYNDASQSSAVAEALKEREFPHHLWLVKDEENSIENGGTGRTLEHSFDSDDMKAGETNRLEREFAARVWDGFLAPLVE